MTQEEKQLLLVDLCARLPYGIICQMEDALIINDSPFYDCILSERHIALFRNHKDFYIKPYLRPMSSMTEEEMEEFENFVFPSEEDENGNYQTGVLEKDIPNYTNWLNKKMFDYRGLIPKGLALEAPEGMYNS